MSKNPRITAKERNLIKGALRRVFSRSELRRSVIDRSRVLGRTDPLRPRVTKWSRCPICQRLEPTYKMEVDHIVPIVPVDSTLELMTWDDVVDRIWCEASNLVAICKPCHHNKSKLEAKERAIHRKKNKNK